MAEDPEQSVRCEQLPQAPALQRCEWEALQLRSRQPHEAVPINVAPGQDLRAHPYELQECNAHISMGSLPVAQRCDQCVALTRA